MITIRLLGQIAPGIHWFCVSDSVVRCRQVVAFQFLGYYFSSAKIIWCLYTDSCANYANFNNDRGSYAGDLRAQHHMPNTTPKRDLPVKQPKDLIQTQQELSDKDLVIFNAELGRQSKGAWLAYVLWFFSVAWECITSIWEKFAGDFSTSPSHLLDGGFLDGG